MFDRTSGYWFGCFEPTAMTPDVAIFPAKNAARYDAELRFACSRLISVRLHE